MSYEANVYSAMIASPGDVSSERAIIREVIHEWNAIHSKYRRIVLLPVGWETHASPEMGSSAQDVINRQVLDMCDLLVGVFWTRIGTKTEKHISGSVEEIERHIDAGKPAMLYFSKKPVELDSVDRDQYEELQKFKQSCLQRGLLESYSTHGEFRENFYRQLQLKMNEDRLFLGLGIEGADGNKSKSIIESSFDLPQLSSQARVILKEASLGDGRILMLRLMRGSKMQLNSNTTVEFQDRREFAKWESGLEHLAQLELIVGRGSKGEVFELTDLGYRVADMIEI